MRTFFFFPRRRLVSHVTQPWWEWRGQIFCSQCSLERWLSSMLRSHILLTTHWKYRLKYGQKISWKVCTHLKSPHLYEDNNFKSGYFMMTFVEFSHLHFDTSFSRQTINVLFTYDTDLWKWCRLKSCKWKISCRDNLQVTLPCMLQLNNPLWIDWAQCSDQKGWIICANLIWHSTAVQ